MLQLLFFQYLHAPLPFPIIDRFLTVRHETELFFSKEPGKEHIVSTNTHTITIHNTHHTRTSELKHEKGIQYQYREGNEEIGRKVCFWCVRCCLRFARISIFV